MPLTASATAALDTVLFNGPFNWPFNCYDNDCFCETVLITLIFVGVPNVGATKG